MKNLVSGDETKGGQTKYTVVMYEENKCMIQELAGGITVSSHKYCQNDIHVCSFRST